MLKVKLFTKYETSNYAHTVEINVGIKTNL